MSKKIYFFTLILSFLSLAMMTSCLAGSDDKSGNLNGTGGSQPNVEIYTLEVNGKNWQIYKSDATLVANTDEDKTDYTASLVAVDASNSLTVDSKQLHIHFDASDLESVEGENISLDDKFNITYRIKMNPKQLVFKRVSGIMTITEVGEGYVKLGFNNLKVNHTSGTADFDIVNEDIVINGSIKCLFESEE